MSIKHKELTALTKAEADIYFSSTWYKEQMKNKRLKLINLGLIKQKKVLH